MAIYREQLNELYYHAKMLVILIEELNHSADELTKEQVVEAYNKMGANDDKNIQTGDTD